MPELQLIKLGTTSNDGTGDPLPLGGDKINDNFQALWQAVFTDLPATIGAKATNVALGSVILDQPDPAARVVTTRTLTGADGLGVIFRPVAGKAYVREPSGGLYYELVVYFVVGTPSLGINPTGLTFAALPPA